jgi:hypothetical protein
MPNDLFGYWLFNEDLTFFNNFGNFNVVSTAGLSLVLSEKKDLQWHSDILRS